MDVKQELVKIGFIPKTVRYGKINRCSTIYKRHSRNGWFIPYDSFIIYGTWDNTIEKGYIHKNKEVKIDWDRINRITKEALEKEYQEQILKKDEIQSKFYSYPLINGVKHEYIVRKKSHTRTDLRLHNGSIIIPMYDIDFTVCGFQEITKDGGKKFAHGSQVKGTFYYMARRYLKDIDLVFLCEGYATGTSIYQCLGELFADLFVAVVVCFSANNVDNVHDVIKEKYPNHTLIAIKDQDKAGRNVKCKGFTVHWQNGYDANDTHLEYGLEYLEKFIYDKMNKGDYD